MYNSDFQIVYSSSNIDKTDFHWLFKTEANAMKNIGISVGTYPFPESKRLMYRGLSIKKEIDYPKDSRFINSFESNKNYLYLSNYYSCISDLIIETFFEEELNNQVVKKIKDLKWEKAFIKKEVTALEHIEEGKSVWPNTSFDEMKKLYEEMQIDGKFAIRKFIEKDIIDQEERYWVFNGNIYHRHNKIPDVVKEATQRLNKLGSKYYTIDATPEFIVEVNPGESSDRHAVNSAELFASWIKKEFVK